MAFNSTKDKYIGSLICGYITEITRTQVEGIIQKNIFAAKFSGKVFDIRKFKVYANGCDMMLVLARHLTRHNDIYPEDLHAEYHDILDFQNYRERSLYTIFNILNEVPIIGKCIPYNSFNQENIMLRIAPIGLMPWNSDQTLIAVKDAIFYTNADREDYIYSAFLQCRIINAFVNDLFNSKYEYFYYIMELASCYSPIILTKLIIVRDCLYVNPLIENITNELLGRENTFQINIIDSLCCSLYVFFRFYENPKEAINYANNLNFDTDIIVKIVGVLCGALYGTTWIPEEWKSIKDEKELFYLGNKLYDISQSLLISYNKYK